MVSSFESGLRIRPASYAGAFTYAHTAGAPTLSPGKGITNSGMLRCATGPWGEIEYHHVYLEASAQLLSHYPMPSTRSRWSFPGATRKELEALFDAARIPRDWVEQWLSPAHSLNEGGVIHILPPIGHLEGLQPEQRSVIYGELAAHAANHFHRDPVFITSGDVWDYFRHTGVAADHIRWFERMCYRRGSVLCFADHPALIGRGRGAAEARRLFNVCSRTRAVIARLRVSAGTDCAALQAYWENRTSRKSVLPLLHGLMDLGEEGTLDLIHLLPPLARKLLNSYPPLELAKHGRMPDCHWSTLNFFNYEPHECFLDMRLSVSHVLENYDQVNEPYRYGDALFFNDAPDGRSFHSCVYLADDLVFAKNGEGAANPWCITHLEEQKQVYLSGRTGQIQAYRRRAGAQK